MSFPGPGRKGPPPPNRDQAPSDSQSKEKLIVYVYEYLTHNGAPETARHFLQEIGQPPNITLQNDAPGFLQSWWNVFWDLYCAAPERRETCDHSVEARVFHDHFGLPQMNGIHGQHAYPSSSASPLGMPGPSGPDGFPPGGPQGLGPGGPPFMGGPLRQSQGQPGVSQPSPHSGAVGSMPNVPPFAGGPRYPRGPMPPMGMGPGGPEMRFNGPPVGMFPEHLRPNSVPPHMLGPGGPHQRLGPSNSMGPVRNMGPSPSPIQHFNPNMRNPQPNLRPPMSMNNGWSPSTSAMSFCGDYPDANGHIIGGGMMSNGPGPGTPIMPSPQNMPSESSGERYHVLGSHAPSFAPMNSDVSGGGGQEVVMNGDDLKNSPAGSSHGRNGGTPGSQHGQGPNSVPPSSQAPGSAESMDHYSAPAFADNSNRYQEQSEIQKIKESMMAETRQFESGKDGSDSGSEFLGCM